MSSWNWGDEAFRSFWGSTAAGRALVRYDRCPLLPDPRPGERLDTPPRPRRTAPVADRTGVDSDAIDGSVWPNWCIT